MSKILEGVEPSEIKFVHIIAEQGDPTFSIAHRIRVTDCSIGDGFLEFKNPFLPEDPSIIRIDNHRIMLVEYGKFVMPEIE